MSYYQVFKTVQGHRTGSPIQDSRDQANAGFVAWCVAVPVGSVVELHADGVLVSRYVASDVEAV
jgi:hypothetical protein